MGEAFGLVEVLHGNHAAQVEGVVHHQDLFDPVLVQQALYLLRAGALFHCHQLVPRCHDRRDQFLRVGFKAKVPAGDNTHQVSAVQYRYAGDTVSAGQLHQLGYSGVLLDGDGVLDHAAFEFLDLAHLFGLLFHAHALVNDADAALLGHGDGQAPLSDRVHGR